jgi:hypothetical protein
LCGVRLVAASDVHVWRVCVSPGRLRGLACGGLRWTFVCEAEYTGSVDTLDVAERFVKQVVLGVPRLRQKLAVMLSTITIADTLGTVVAGLSSVRTACTEVRWKSARAFVFEGLAFLAGVEAMGSRAYVRCV